MRSQAHPCIIADFHAGDLNSPLEKRQAFQKLLWLRANLRVRVQEVLGLVEIHPMEFRAVTEMVRFPVVGAILVRHSNGIPLIFHLHIKNLPFNHCKAHHPTTTKPHQKIPQVGLHTAVVQMNEYYSFCTNLSIHLESRSPAEGPFLLLKHLTSNSLAKNS